MPRDAAGIPMESRKKIALIAHDNKKTDMIEWIRFNKELLARHDLYATRTTGRLVARALGLHVTEFHSGPLGGDQQSKNRAGSVWGTTCHSRTSRSFDGVRLRSEWEGRSSLNPLLTSR